MGGGIGDLSGRRVTVSALTRYLRVGLGLTCYLCMHGAFFFFFDRICMVFY
jgi:hypothetical protein